VSEPERVEVERNLDTIATVLARHTDAASFRDGDKREDAAAEAYSKAAKLKPRDAMEALDIAWAKDQLA
jgi:hypothetical protein